MGNSASSSSRAHHDETVDYGYLSPQGVYTGPRDWNQAIVSQLICQRRLAPFYRPLEDYEENWTDDQILAARKELPISDTATVESTSSTTTTRIEAVHPNSSKIVNSKRPPTLKDPIKPEAAVYRGAVECPICFLYYPPNINHSRCCDQAICTECFVQIKRTEPTATHLDSEPAACPYCVQENLGVVYSPPPWRAGIGSEGTSSIWPDSGKGIHQSIDTSPPFPTHKRRQKSFGADSPEVVTTDQIRPDWEAKLAAVRAAVTRRANRRIIMRQVGDRLIPVGVTSGRVHPINPEDLSNEGNEAGSSGGRRSRRRQQQQPQEFGQYMGGMGMPGQDLEELMIMEAMRLSLLDHEEQQRKEAEERAKKKKDGSGDDAEPSSSLQVPNSAGPSSLPGSSNQATSSNEPSPRSSAPSSRPRSAGLPSPLTPTSSGSANARLSRSRSRTPSPAISHTNPDQTVAPRAPSESPTNEQGNSRSSPPLSTLRAAMTAVATTSAVDSPLSRSVPNREEASSTGVATPIITSGEAAERVATPAAEEESGSRPPVSHQDSFASSIASEDDDGVVYDTLPSSPESTISHKPLMEDDAGTPTTSAIPTDTSSDYFGERSSGE